MNADEEVKHGLFLHAWIESKKLWCIVGPSIFSRVQLEHRHSSLRGSPGDLELAAITLSTGVIVGFNFGQLVRFINFLKLIIITR